MQKDANYTWSRYEFFSLMVKKGLQSKDRLYEKQYKELNMKMVLNYRLLLYSRVKFANINKI